MKKKSLMDLYSDGSYKSKKGKSQDKPAMVDYHQLYKGDNQTKKVTESHKETLDEKIAKRNPVPEKADGTQTEVEIGGVTYLVTASSEVSEAHIRRVAELADEIYTTTKEENQYTTTHKLAILSLFEACDTILRLKAEKESLKTELTYYKAQNRQTIEKEEKGLKPTPMEELAGKAAEDKK